MRFAVYASRQDGGQELAVVDTSEDGAPAPLAARETDWLSFEVQGISAAMDPVLWIGDVAVDDQLSGSRRDTFWWEDGQHLDGARGRTRITVRDRADSDVILAEIMLQVTESKLSPRAYRQLFADMEQVGIDLFLDLSGKSRAGFVERGHGRPSVVSGRVELIRIEQLWAEIAAHLRVAAITPSPRVRRTMTTRALRPSDKRTPQVVRHLAARPFRNGATAILSLPTLSRTVAKKENAILAAVLSELIERLDHHQGIVQADRDRLRDQLQLDQGDVYHGARLRREKLEIDGAFDRIVGLRNQIAAMRGLLSEGGATPPVPHGGSILALRTPLFEAHPLYARIAKSLRRFLLRSAVIIEPMRDDVTAKGLETLFEQWLFFRTALAIRENGLSCISHKRVFEPVTRGRYVMDLERNSLLEFEASDGRRLSLRYEPLIQQIGDARDIDTLYRPGQGAAFRPDILIEVSTPGRDKSDYRLRFAAIIDAKYRMADATKKLEALARYADIRSVRTNRQIVRSIWVGTPQGPPDIKRVGDDSALAGRPRRSDDLVQGILKTDPGVPGETAKVMVEIVETFLMHADEYAAAMRSDEADA